MTEPHICFYLTEYGTFTTNDAWGCYTENQTDENQRTRKLPDEWKDLSASDQTVYIGQMRDLINEALEEYMHDIADQYIWETLDINSITRKAMMAILNAREGDEE